MISILQKKKERPKKALLPAECFKAPTNDKDMTRICKGFVPPNTQKNTAWALRLFAEWRAERKKKVPSTSDSLSPYDLLENPQPESITFWLSRFINEVQKQDGAIIWNSIARNSFVFHSQLG